MDLAISIGSAAVVIIFLFYTCMELVRGKGIMRSKFMNNKYIKAAIRFFTKKNK